MACQSRAAGSVRPEAAQPQRSRSKELNWMRTAGDNRVPYKHGTRLNRGGSYVPERREGGSQRTSTKATVRHIWPLLVGSDVLNRIYIQDGLFIERAVNYQPPIRRSGASVEPFHPVQRRADPVRTRHHLSSSTKEDGRRTHTRSPYYII